MERLPGDLGKRFRAFLEREGKRGRAGELPHLVEVLRHAPVEAAAVLLQLHPFVIDELRLRLASGELVLPTQPKARPSRCRRPRS